MKKIVLFTLLVFTVFYASSQIVEPVKWTTSVEKVSDTEYVLVSKANIDAGWHLYSQEVKKDGPIATKFTYNHKKYKFKLVGTTKEGKGYREYDRMYRMKIKYFKDNTVFRQRIKFSKAPKNNTIRGSVDFMCCNDTNCTQPLQEDLVYDLTNIKSSTSSLANEETKTVLGAEEQQKKHKLEKTIKENKKSTQSLWAIFFIAFLSGFAALVTPCVFPMIPMTVSFFTKQSKTKSAGIRNAIFYGISIIVIYVLLGTGITTIFGSDSLNALSTSVLFNVVFFFILLIFAVSFLGAFEITLPSSWGTKIDSQADKGGLIGIFFMALALAVVSFSCTGPIVGTLLVQAASKGGLAPIVGMLGFALAIALPFAIFAAFPGWMNSLPKSGGWLNTVKVFLGFLELAFAFKFLSNADLVLQTHLLEREVFLVIWIVIFGTLAFYLFGKIRLPHDSPISHISVGRLSLAMFVMVFTIYLIPGLWGAPLKLISGFPPPMKYSESPHGVGYTSSSTTKAKISLPEGAKLGEYDIIIFDNYDKGLAYAKQVRKPVLLDFTGHACVNCRKMEQYVWSDSKVLKVLQEDVVLVSLYVDDKRSLPEGEVIESKVKPGKILKSIGEKWSELQIIKYKANTQPLYVMMDLEENNLSEPKSYDSDPKSFYKWLQKGINQFNK